MQNLQYLHRIVECDNIIKALKSYAEAKEVPIAELDFVLERISLFVKEEEKGEFVRADDNMLLKLGESDFLNKPELKIIQRYDIGIIKAKHDSSKPRVLLAANKMLTKAFAVIKYPKSEYFDELEQFLFDEILKLKARNDFIINSKDNALERDVKEYCKFLKNGEKLEDFKIPIGFAPEPKATVDAKIDYKYLKTAQGACHLESPGEANCLISVKKDQILITYHKPVKGDNGRNCKGEFILAPDPLEEVKIDFDVDNTIKKEDNGDTVDYVATIAGFLKSDKNRFTIEKELSLADISLANTGSILADLDSDTKIKAGTGDMLKDAVGEGIHIKVSQVEIEGNLANNTQIIANKIVINGQSHKNSRLEAKEIDVDVHRGLIVGDEVNVNRLEHGEIEGRTVRIKKLMGGVVKAKEIYVEELLSHAELFASKLIDIEQIKGEENWLTIDPAAYFKDRIEIELLKKEQHDFQSAISKLQEDYRKDVDLINRTKFTIEKIVNEIKVMKQNNQQPPKLYVQKIQEYKEALNDAKEKSLEIESIKRDLQATNAKIVKIQAESEDAKIITHSPYVGYNEVHFLQLEPKNDFVKKPLGKMDVLKLVENDDGTKEIKSFSLAE